MTPEGGPGLDGATIGEVLNRLRPEFADVTISKIRFLESEGLISPARTPSGYRKFSDDDVDRLRFILTAQRDHHLPLKVIRAQLERLDAEHAEPSPERIGPPPEEVVEEVAERTSAPAEPPVRPEERVRLTGGDDRRMTVRELVDRTGLEPTELRELRDHGLIGERADAQATYDADDLITAQAGRDLMRLGLEPRHLRMYRQFVEREVALFEQVAGPLLRQRDPEARRQATRQLEDLATASSRLRRSLLSGMLRGHVQGG